MTIKYYKLKKTIEIFLQPLIEQKLNNDNDNTAIRNSKNRMGVVSLRHEWRPNPWWDGNSFHHLTTRHLHIEMNGGTLWKYKSTNWRETIVYLGTEKFRQLATFINLQNVEMNSMYVLDSCSCRPLKPLSSSLAPRREAHQRTSIWTQLLKYCMTVPAW